MFNLVLVFLFTVLVAFFVSLPVIWALKVFRIGQVIREECPASHRKKAGTPTMGGVAIILVVTLLVLILINVDLSIKYASLLFMFLGFAVLGFTDDYLKIRKRQNRGLSGLQKIIMQIIFASVFAGVLVYLGHAEGLTGLLKFFRLDAPYLYFVFVAFVIIGSSNAVNLTDGLDGLAAGTLAIAFIAFGLIAFRLQHVNEAIIAFVAAGAVFSFLKFNFYPAEVFMGDVGSLALGALLAGVAILLHEELLLVVIGGVFVAEASSVILQVSSFKLFKHRIFRMTPLHHHFELVGVSERTIVLSFYLAAFLLAVIGFFVYRFI